VKQRKKVARKGKAVETTMVDPSAETRQFTRKQIAKLFGVPVERYLLPDKREKTS